MPALLEQTDHPLVSLRADGTYDRKSVYEAAQRKGNGQVVRVLIPPTRNARLKSSPSTAMEERNRNVRAIRELGRRKWYIAPRSPDLLPPTRNLSTTPSHAPTPLWRGKPVGGGYLRVLCQEIGVNDQ